MTNNCSVCVLTYYTLQRVILHSSQKLLSYPTKDGYCHQFTFMEGWSKEQHPFDEDLLLRIKAPLNDKTLACYWTDRISRCLISLLYKFTHAKRVKSADKQTVRYVLLFDGIDEYGFFNIIIIHFDMARFLLHCSQYKIATQG